MKVQVRLLVLPEWSLDLEWERTLSGEERAEHGKDRVAFTRLSSLEDCMAFLSLSTGLTSRAQLGRSSTPSCMVWVTPRALWATPF